MKTVKKNVYYCDHCKKRGLSLHHMRTHEWHCTANPNRSCRLCAGGSIADLIAQFKARFTLTENPWRDEDHLNGEAWPSHIVTWIGEPITLEEVKKAVDGCPNCMLAILRQVGLNRHYFDLEEFRYQQELKNWHDSNICIPTHSPYDY